MLAAEPLHADPELADKAIARDLRALSAAHPRTFPALAINRWMLESAFPDWTNTVSYVDIAFGGAWTAGALTRAPGAAATSFALPPADKRTLLSLARASLDASVHKGGYDPTVAREIDVTASLRRKAGAFVTLKCQRGTAGRCVGRGHDLRGCIGTIPPLAPVLETVARRAASAALEDPRFAAVRPDELRHISIEVSVLTPPREVAGPEAIVVGRHGIILHKGLRSATFLPQVALEQGWDRDTTLSQLARKAGLGPDGWRDDARLQVYEAIVISEQQGRSMGPRQAR